MDHIFIRYLHYERNARRFTYRGTPFPPRITIYPCVLLLGPTLNDWTRCNIYAVIFFHKYTAAILDFKAILCWNFVFYSLTIYIYLLS